MADEVEPPRKKAKVTKRALDRMWENGLWVCHEGFEEFLVSATGSMAFANTILEIEEEDKEDEDKEATHEYAAAEKGSDSDGEAA